MDKGAYVALPLATMSTRGMWFMSGIVLYLLGTVAGSVILSIVANLLTPAIGRRLSQWANGFANARALRSRRQTEKRLHKLQQQLAAANKLAEALPPYTRALWLNVFYILLSLCVCAGILLVIAAFFAYDLLKPDARTRYTVELFSALAALFAIVGIRKASGVIASLQYSMSYKRQLEASIAKLQSRLNAPDAP